MSAPLRRRLPSLVYGYFHRQWRNDLTAGGKTLVWCIALSGIGTVSVQMPLYQAFCALVMLLAVASGACSLLRPRVNLVPRLPPRATVGVPVIGSVTLTNRRRLPAFDVCVGFFDLPAAFAAPPETVAVEYLPGRATAEAAVTLTPRRRGRFALPPVRAWSTFPFHIGRGGGRRGEPAGSLLVRPAFAALDRLPLPTGGGRGGGGGESGRKEGQSAEFLGNRELRPGEPAVRLDARAWARTGRPIVRQYREEPPAGVAVLFDPRVDAGASDEQFERAVSRAAAACEAVVRGGAELTLFAAGGDVHRFRPGTNRAALEAALDALALVEPAGPDALGDPLGDAADLWAGLNEVAAVALVSAREPARPDLVRRLGSGGRTVFPVPGGPA